MFPHVCDGCGSDLLSQDSRLCMRCMHILPSTSFEWYRSNPVERKFYGRVPVENATAQFYFTKRSLVQHLIHQVKYGGNRDLGVQLGRMMGDHLRSCGRFPADVMLPLPLFPGRQRRRGYNQSELLCEGMAQHLHLPVLNNVLIRPEHTETQTHKGRVERWKNIEGKFHITDTMALTGKHLLLVDDVITTGATLEAGTVELLKAEDVSVSIACLCYSA